MSIFSNNLKQLRKAKGITQAQLANILNVSQNAIYNWENNKREPSIEMQKKIAKYFNVSLDHLIGLLSFMEEYDTQQNKLNIDNAERHHILLYYYNEMQRTGRDALIDILSNLRILNEQGQKEAVKRVQELTEIKKYTEDLKNYAEFVSDKTPEYWQGLKKTLEVAAAHNDQAEEPGELEKMQEDVEKRKRPED